MIQKLYRFAADWICARIPQPMPPLDRIAAAAIVSHRGEHDNRRVFENTLAAFDAAVTAGVDGIEFDIRWTRDLVPIVFHDGDLSRLFKENRRVREFHFNTIRSDFPSIPSLSEVVARYGGRVHLMAEIKKENYPDAECQSQVLQSVFSHLRPAKDYHFLSLDPESFRFVSFVPVHTCLPVSELNFSSLSRLALKKGYGGILGHFSLIGKKRIARHRNAGQQVGTGYIASKNCFYREVNRGVEWLFTENAKVVSVHKRHLLARGGVLQTLRPGF